MQTQAPEQYDISPCKLWSLIQRQLSTCGLTKGSPQQWIGTIRNLQKKGVSSVEIEWSEVLLWLGESAESDSVFDELCALAAALDGKPAPVRDEHPSPVVRLDELLGFLTDKPPCELVLQRRITDEYAPQVRYEKQAHPVSLSPFVVRHGQREVRLLHYRDRTFGLCVWLHVEVDQGLFGRNRYWTFSVPRGRKKMGEKPTGQRFASAHEAMAYGRALVARLALRLKKEGFVSQIRSDNKFFGYVLPDGDHYTEWLITAPNLSERYWGEHFDLPSIVAHVRTTERTTTQGARLLVLEELQSDWNQELRKSIQEARERDATGDENTDLIVGVDDMDPPPLNPYLNHWLEAALRMMLLLAANQGVSGMAWLPGKLHAERFPWANAEGLKTFYDRIVPAAVEKLGKSWGVSLGEAQFSTMSRSFKTEKVAGMEKWRVLNLDSGRIVGEDFLTYAMAEDFRKTKEIHVQETVPALFVSPEMRADIAENGLPYLGAVGKRALAG